MPPLPPPNPYIAGAAVGGERGFFGREDILREVERTLRRPADNAIVLFGQRRIGKTSILLQLQHRLPAPPFVPIYFDLMDKARLPVGQVLYELAITIAAEVGLPTPPRADFEGDSAAFHRTFLPTFYQALGEERRPVLLLDEFDTLDPPDERDLPETAAAHSFFPYLRQIMGTERRLAFVFVVGRRMEELSVGFLSTFKMAPARRISVLRPEEAHALVLLAEREGMLRYAEAAVERILVLTRGHPYLTQLTCQLLFDRAFDRPPDDTPLVTVADVEAVIPWVLETGGNAFQWIWEGLPPAERIIFSAIASQAKEGVLLSEGDITATLQTAGIRILIRELNLAPKTLVDWQMLEQVDGGYRFFVELMRHWVAENRPLDRVKDELERLVPLAESLYQTAQAFHRQKNNEQAVGLLRQALATNPNHLKARLLLGMILREENRLAEAAVEFEEVYRLDEREGRFEVLRTLLQQGESLEKAGDEAGALAAYDRALAVSPREQTAGARRTALWEKRGDQALAAGDFEVALDAYRQAGAEEKLAQIQAQQLKLESEQAAQEGEDYETQGEWAKAAEVYRRLAELDPDDERWRQALERAEEELWLVERYAEGTGYMQQAEWAKAQRTLASVINKRPDYRDAAELLALAKQRGRGQPDLARIPRRRLVLAGAGGAVLLLLAVAGMWSYSQIQNQAQATRLAATAIAQATAAEEAAVTRVAAAIQGTQLAELQATQTTEAGVTQTVEAGLTATAASEVQATQTAEAGGTATAAAIATQTAQAPTATPTPTRTPSPTPTPTATIDADRTVYDNFNNPAFDGSFNPGRWAGVPGLCAQQDGVLVVKRGEKPNSSAGLGAIKYESFALNAPTFFEARLMTKDGKPESHVFLILGFVLPSGEFQFSDCTLSYSSDKQGWNGCNYVYSEHPVKAYGAEGSKLVDYGTWHTVRIEVDPSTMNFTYFIDGQVVGTHVSENADELKRAKFSLGIGVWGTLSDAVTGYIDDVRIGPVGQ